MPCGYINNTIDMAPFEYAVKLNLFSEKINTKIKFINTNPGYTYEK